MHPRTAGRGGGTIHARGGAREGDTRRHRGGGTSRALQGSHKSRLPNCTLHPTPPTSRPPSVNPASRSITQRDVIFLVRLGVLGDFVSTPDSLATERAALRSPDISVWSPSPSPPRGGETDAYEDWLKDYPAPVLPQLLPHRRARRGEPKRERARMINARAHTSLHEGTWRGRR